MGVQVEPLCQPIATAVAVADEDAFVVLDTLSHSEAVRLAHQHIRGSVFRPEDIKTAAIDPTRLCYVPYWRFHVSAEGFHIGLSHGHDQTGNLKWVLPTGGRRRREAVVLVEARKVVPFVPKLSDPEDVRSRLHFAFSIEREHMSPRAPHEALDGEVVAPDIAREVAERRAISAILSFARPSNALYSKYEPTVLSAVMCHYPLHITTYRYEGHARKEPGERFYVTLSGKSGKVVASHHPSALRSLARKLRNLLSP